MGLCFYASIYGKRNDRKRFQLYNINECVILFGSRARGDYGRCSDIDLAVRGGNTAGFALDVDEEIWLRALQARNNVTHAYNSKIALDIVMQAKECFYKMFSELKTEIETTWL